MSCSRRLGSANGEDGIGSTRYADSNGWDRNVMWYHAWRYRDYVIASFNADKPFVQFVREQIAGDLLAAKSRTEGNASQGNDSPTGRDELRIATGFLALGPKAFAELKPGIFRMDVIDEQIEVIAIARMAKPGRG